MNGLNPGIDLGFLIGREIIQVSIGVWQIIFHFDSNTTISVESVFQIRTFKESSEWQSGSLINACSALTLIGCTTDGVEGNADGTLTLKFAGDASLVVLDSKKDYESYTISRKGETIVV